MENKTAISGKAKETLDNSKLEAFAIHILEECEEKGFTANEVRRLTFVYQEKSNEYLRNLQDGMAFKIVENI